MKLSRNLVAALLVVGALSGVAPMAHAFVVERVVAVVGDQAILYSELRQRCRPYLVKIHQRFPPGAVQAAQENQLYRQMLARMIDERLIRVAADKLRVTVTAEEVESAIERLANVQGLTPEQLIAEAGRDGLTPSEYREEIRRQLLEGKLLEHRVKGRVRVTEEDLRAAYARLRREERPFLGYSLQWIVLRIPAGASPEVRTQRRELADSIVAQLRAGADFGQLARAYSDDGNTRDKGGDVGRAPEGGFEDPVEKAAFSLEVGEISAPFAYADALVIIRVSARDRSRIGEFEVVRDLLAQRVAQEQMDKAKRAWLDGLKRSVHVETRL